MKTILLAAVVTIMNFSLLKAISPAIVIEPKNEGRSISFKLSAKVDNTNITIDWGKGVTENFIIGTKDTLFTGESQETEIKIYGSSIARFKIEQLPLKRVNFADNSGIKNVQIVNCQIDSLGLINNNNLDTLIVNSNNLQTLNIDGDTSLVHLEFSGNSISKVDLLSLKKLQTLAANTNTLSSIDLSQNNLLEHVDLQYNIIDSINFSNLKNLKVVHLLENKIKEIDVSNNPLLTDLVCSYNLISSVDLSHNPLLVGIGLGSNNLDKLDVTKNPEITYLNVNNNKLKNIDLSKNTKLQWLRLSGNNLLSIDVTAISELQQLELADNRLWYINLNNNPKLWRIDITNNDLRIKYVPVQKTGWSEYLYQPQLKIILAYREYNTYDMIDLSSEVSRDGISSVFTWKNTNGKTLVKNEDYAESTGMFSFIKEQNDSVYCEITNSLFPNLILETSKFKVVSTTGIKTIPKINFTLYPNPFTDYVLIKSEEPINKVEVYNSLGLKLLECSVNSLYEFKLQLGNYKSGLYLIKVNRTFKSVLKI